MTHLHASLLFMLMWSQNTATYIEPGPFIVEEMARRIVLQKMPEHSWAAMVRTSPKKEAMFATLSLNADGMTQKLHNDSKSERINLHYLDIYWACRLQSIETCTANLKTYLKNAAIDLNAVGLGFFDNEPAYIIGANNGDMVAPQLWVSKNSFRPVKEKKPGSEYTWDKWILLLDGTFEYPRLINIKEGNKITTISAN